LKRKGKLSPNDEIKWLDRLKKKQEKLEDLKEDLKKSEKELDKLD
jgi:colicin import membrane protein